MRQPWWKVVHISIYESANPEVPGTLQIQWCEWSTDLLNSGRFGISPYLSLCLSQFFQCEATRKSWNNIKYILSSNLNKPKLNKISLTLNDYLWNKLRLIICWPLHLGVVVKIILHNQCNGAKMRLCHQHLTKSLLKDISWKKSFSTYDKNYGHENPSSMNANKKMAVKRS